MLFSRQLLNGSKDFFLFNILILIFFFKRETIETHAREILTLTILSKGTVLTKKKYLYLTAQNVIARHNLLEGAIGTFKEEKN